MSNLTQPKIDAADNALHAFPWDEFNAYPVYVDPNWTTAPSGTAIRSVRTQFLDGWFHVEFKPGTATVVKSYFTAGDHVKFEPKPKVEPVTMYRTLDGKLFETEEDALAYEDRALRRGKLFALLEPEYGDQAWGITDCVLANLDTIKEILK